MTVHHEPGKTKENYYCTRANEARQPSHKCSLCQPAHAKGAAAILLGYLSTTLVIRYVSMHFKLALPTHFCTFFDQQTGAVGTVQSINQSINGS